MATNRILIVDDEETLCEVLKLNLENEGYDVDIAFSAEQRLMLLLQLRMLRPVKFNSVLKRMVLFMPVSVKRLFLKSNWLRMQKHLLKQLLKQNRQALKVLI